MPYVPLTAPQGAIPAAPTEVPVWSSTASRTLHGRQDCSTLARAKKTVESSLDVVNGEPEGNYHCAGDSPEWRQLDAHRKARRTYEDVNAQVQAAWEGDVWKFDGLLDMPSSTPDDVKAYVKTATDQMRSEGAITDQALLVALIRSCVANMSFKTNGDGGLADFMAERANVHLATAMGCEPAFSRFRDLARSWSGNGRSSAVNAAHSIHWSLRSARGNLDDAAFGQLATSSVNEIADKIEAAFTTYLLELTTGESVTVTLPVERDWEVVDSAYAKVAGTLTGRRSMLELTMPLATYIALRNTNHFRSRLITVKRNGKTLTDAQLWDLVRSSNKSERARTDKLARAQAQACHQAAAKQAADTQTALQAAWQTALNTPDALTSDQTATLEEAINRYADRQADSETLAHLNALLLHVPGDHRTTFVKAVLDAGPACGVLLAMNPTVLADLIAVLEADTVMSSNTEVLAWTAGAAIANHGDLAAQWAHGLKAPERKVAVRRKRSAEGRSVAS